MLKATLLSWLFIISLELILPVPIKNSLLITHKNMTINQIQKEGNKFDKQFLMER